MLVILITAVPFLIVDSIAYVVASYQCEWRWSGAYQSEYTIFSGCRVKINDKWLPDSVVRVGG